MGGGEKMKREEIKKDSEKKIPREQKVNREITPEELEKVSGGANRYQHRRPV